MQVLQLNTWQTAMCGTRYPQQTRKKLFGLRYLYFTGWSLNQAEEAINWINRAYQSLEHSALLLWQACCPHIFIWELCTSLLPLQPRLCCAWQPWHSLNWWLGTGFRLGMAPVRLSVQQDPAGMVNPKINRQRLPTDPVTQHGLRVHAWHLCPKRGLCGCDCACSGSPLCVLTALSPHPSDPHHASPPHGWGKTPGISDIACLPGGVHDLLHHRPSCAFARAIFKLFKGTFILREEREQPG